MILAFTAGLVIGTVAGTVSWVAAAAYLEAQRLQPAMADAMMAEAMAMTNELPMVSIERSFAFSPEQTRASGRLYRRNKNSVPPITSSESMSKTRNSSL